MTRTLMWLGILMMVPVSAAADPCSHRSDDRVDRLLVHLAEFPQPQVGLPLQPIRDTSDDWPNENPYEFAVASGGPNPLDQFLNQHVDQSLLWWRGRRGTEDGPTITRLIGDAAPPTGKWSGVLEHAVELPPRIPAAWSPLGRQAEAKSRDDMFYQRAQRILRERYADTTHSFFVNYTGHEGPVAAALAERGIPIFWQLELNGRVADQLLDWRDVLRANPQTNDTNVAVIQEPSHTLFESLRVDLLPDVSELEAKGIRRIVVFSEDEFVHPRAGSWEDLTTAGLDGSLRGWLVMAHLEGIEVIVEGLDDAAANMVTPRSIDWDMIVSLQLRREARRQALLDGAPLRTRGSEDGDDPDSIFRSTTPSLRLRTRP